jgi:hypothetical protein
MLENLSAEDVSTAVEEMIASVGVKEESSCLDLLTLLERKGTEACAQEIAARLALPVRISLSYVSQNFSPANRGGFESSSLSRADSAGHGIDGITAQVSIPKSLPLFGSASLAGYPISVRVSENCSQRPETFVAVMAHELSHVLLRSLCHPQRDSELHTDIVPILLSFRDCVRKGRKVVQSTTTAGATKTQTTTYGYLTDSQFEFVCNKVRGILQRRAREKRQLMTLVKQARGKLRRATQVLQSFRADLAYLDTLTTVKMRERDARRVVQFHAWDHTRDWESAVTQARGNLEAAEMFVQPLRHYTASVVEQLKEYTLTLDLQLKQLHQLVQAIKKDVKTVRRHVGLIYRLRNPIWSPRGRSEPIKLRTSESQKGQRSTKGE